MMIEHLSLDPQCIVKQGYLIKSPPLSEATIIRKRWRMRWFLLYDTQKLCDIDPGLERDVGLYYYKSDTHVVAGAPKGKIPLKDVQIYGQRGRLHGYDHVINIQTNKRLYHLCATQIFVYNSWLDVLREHYVPYQEEFAVERSRCTSCSSYARELRRGSAPINAATIQHLTISSSFNKVDNCDGDSDGDRYDYAYDHCSQYSVDQARTPTRAKTEHRYNDGIKSWLNETSIPKYVPRIYERTSSYQQDEDEESDRYNDGIKSSLNETSIPKYVPPINKRTSSYQGDDEEEEESDYVGMTDLTTTFESEDEGIGRTDSDTSNASSGIITTAGVKQRMPPLKSRLSPRDSLYSEGFVGPKLSTRSSSVGDMTRYVNYQSIRTTNYDI